MERKSQPRVLRKSIRYPTYQLAASTASSKETPEKQLVICALSTLEWVRAKLQELEIPEDFRAPSPDDYEKVSLDSLKSARIEAGYTVEMFCDSEEKLWAFRLIEPDLSTRWDGEKEVSTAVPGRIFETNLAFRAANGTLQCGVSVIVSEPENTTVPSRVHRPAVVQKLAANPLVGLSVGRPLESRIWELNSREKIKNLRNDLQSGYLPAVIFCGYRVKRPTSHRASAVSAPDISQMFAKPFTSLRMDDMPALSTYISELEAEKETEREAEVIPYNTELFASARMAYVHTCRLPADQFDAFEKLFQIEPSNYGVIFIEPRDLGGGHRIFGYSEEAQQENFDTLMDLSRDYLRKKSVKFGNVLFLTEAKLLQAEKRRQNRKDVEDALKESEDQQALMASAYENKLMEKNDFIEQQAAKITRLKNLLNDRDAEADEIRREADEKVAKAQRRVEAMQERLEYLERLPQRPKTPKEVAKWVQDNFQGRLEFHQKAVKKLEAAPQNEVDMQLLCDALEYLAHEYRDVRAGEISWEEAIQRSSDKYGRPFEICPNGATSIEMYASDYKIKYYIGPMGKPIESPLTDHLKVGKSAKNLLRIYFLYDAEKRKIVVGSLPGHLKVAQIQG